MERDVYTIICDKMAPALTGAGFILLEVLMLVLLYQGVTLLMTDVRNWLRGYYKDNKITGVISVVTYTCLIIFASIGLIVVSAVALWYCRK